MNFDNEDRWYEPAIGEASTRSPVQLERTSRVWHRCTTNLQGFCGSFGAREIDETVTGIAAVIRMRRDS